MDQDMLYSWEKWRNLPHHAELQTVLNCSSISLLFFRWLQLFSVVPTSAFCPICPMDTVPCSQFSFLRDSHDHNTQDSLWDTVIWPSADMLVHPLLPQIFPLTGGTEATLWASRWSNLSYCSLSFAFLLLPKVCSDTCYVEGFPGSSIGAYLGTVAGLHKPVSLRSRMQLSVKQRIFWNIHVDQQVGASIHHQRASPVTVTLFDGSGWDVSDACFTGSHLPYSFQGNYTCTATAEREGALLCCQASEVSSLLHMGPSLFLSHNEFYNPTGNNPFDL